jgi:hypothetical protein
MAHRERVRLFLLPLGLGLLIACQKQDGDEGTPPPPPPPPPLILEGGDAASNCASCKKLTGSPPFIIMGGSRKITPPDVDCYCFEGAADATYLVGITGGDRTVSAQGPGDAAPKADTNGLLDVGPQGVAGTICVCVTGGREGGGYLLAIAPS